LLSQAADSADANIMVAACDALVLVMRC
jgi:hypothetical protein